jgi:hypothetical protein
MAFSVWGTLYVLFLLIGYFLVIVRGVFQDRRLSEAIDGNLREETADTLAFIMCCLGVGIALGIGSWTPVEFGICLGSAIFYLQVWTQNGGVINIPFVGRKNKNSVDSDYRITNLGKPIGEMTQEERHEAAKKIADTIASQVKGYDKK